LRNNSRRNLLLSFYRLLTRSTLCVFFILSFRYLIRGCYNSRMFLRISASKQKYFDKILRHVGKWIGWQNEYSFGHASSLIFCCRLCCSVKSRPIWLFRVLKEGFIWHNNYGLWIPPPHQSHTPTLLLSP
jgi:hypothetical protein